MHVIFLTAVTQSLDWKIINTIRTLSIDAIEKANSGHPGLPLGAAPFCYILWKNHLRITPKDPHWINRDRFVLSGGHGSALLYSLLHLWGFDVSIDDLKNFRQLHSLTPGHPEFGHTSGVDATTGPLGQGAANSVGMALAEIKLSQSLSLDHFTYALVTDGDLMEGVVAEAASLAGQLQLGKLIWLYDSNNVTLDGPTSLTFDRENVSARFEAYGWHTQTILDGNRDLESIDQAIIQAKKDPRPSLIIIKTTIGFGAPTKAGKSDAHGSPLGAQELAQTKKSLGFNPEQFFYIPPEIQETLGKIREKNERIYDQWKVKFSQPSHSKIDLKNAPIFKMNDALATRASSGMVLNCFASSLPNLIGGDADLSCSTNTLIKGAQDLSHLTPNGRNLRFGVREHAMASIANGVAYHGGLQIYVATFFCFSDYMKPAIRLAAMNKLPVIYVFTHDSVAVGEDGPTHQPIEHLAALRSIPGLVTFRPADAHETLVAWKIALESTDHPTALVLSRQKVKTVTPMDSNLETSVSCGAYIHQESSLGPPALIIIATGSELELGLQVRTMLEKKGVSSRLVSMPSFELFDRQPKTYQDEILPTLIRKRVSIEAASTFGWSRWVGLDGLSIGINRFGVSAPGEQALKYLGLDADKIVEKIVNHFNL